MLGYFNMEDQTEFIRKEALEKGRAESAELLGTLIARLLSPGRTDDVQRAANDADYRNQRYNAFQPA